MDDKVPMLVLSEFDKDMVNLMIFSERLVLMAKDMHHVDIKEDQALQVEAICNRCSAKYTNIIMDLLTNENKAKVAAGEDITQEFDNTRIAQEVLEYVRKVVEC